MVKDLAPFNFFGFTAAKPMAMRIRVQNVKTSNDLHSATSHFADSSGSKAPRLVTTGLLGSMVPYGFRNRTSKKSGVLTIPTKPACATMENAVENLEPAPARRLYAPIITRPTSSAKQTGTKRPAA